MVILAGQPVKNGQIQINDPVDSDSEAPTASITAATLASIVNCVICKFL